MTDVLDHSQSHTGTAAETVARADCVVIKVGSALLVDARRGTLRTQWLDQLTDDIAQMRQRGQRVVVVSSGSIALGRRVLGLPSGTLSLEQSQAAAAVGQSRLVQGWQTSLDRHELTAAQVLLTLDDTQKRRRYLNGRQTLATLLSLGTVPIVNENDTVATDEIRYGDNDRLAARVALMAAADALVLLSDVDGLYTANPRDVPDAAFLPTVHEITPEIEAMAGGTGTAGAKGGMKTKLQAAQIAVQGGCSMIVTLGDVARPISALHHGARATVFPAATEANAARKQWIAGMKPVGTIVVDDGAAAALMRGNSLLSAGVREVAGDFDRGDPVTIADLAGTALGAALSAYAADEARAIAGARSGDIEEILGHAGRSAVAHRDDMVIWGH